MRKEVVSSRPADAALTKRLKGTSAAIPHGTEVVVAYIDCPKNLAPVLESLYYDGDAGGTGYLRFKVCLDGYELPFDWANSQNPIGEVGKPEPIGEDLAPGRRLEVRCANEATASDVAADATLDTLRAYCDGEVAFYETALRGN